MPPVSAADPGLPPNRSAWDDESLAAEAYLPPPPRLQAPLPSGTADLFRLPQPPCAPPMDALQLTGYRLRREVGRGAMGVVFEAEQTDLKRVVAVKLLHPAAPLGDQALARFRAEAEAAARLSHPNIVGVHGLGEADGRPFLVMEYVAGGSLAARLAGAPLPAREAAGLVAAVAGAVAHSHRRGVVHRDLKPANVLIAADGTPKVTDFGLAKLLDADAGQTRAGAVLGTPAYMAPEQAAGGAAAAGPPADVYALGVILYECLTGRPPFRAASAAETLHLVATADPVPARRLAPQVPRDLETIAARCLEKDPARRYQSADAVRADLARFLDGRPILARPAGLAERVGKWCRRRPAWAALIGFVALAAAAAGVGIAAFTARLQREVDRANRGEGEALRQMERADADYRAARAALQRMLDRVRGGRRDVPAVKDLQREQAEDALAFFQAVAGRDDDRPEVRHDAARAGREAAHLQLVLGRRAEAQANLARARDHLAALAEESPDRFDYKADLARTLTDLGAAEAADDPAVVPPCLTAALALWEGVVKASPGSVEYRDGLAICHHVLGNYFYARRASTEAANHYRAAIHLRDQVLKTQPQSRDVLRRLAGTLLNLSVVLQQTPAGAAEAQATHDRAEACFEQLLRDDPDELETVSNLAVMRVNWAYVLANRGQTDAALADLAKNVVCLDDVLKREPNAQAARDALYRTHGTRAALLSRVGRHAEAAAAWERVVATAPPEEQNNLRLSLADALARAGDHGRAVAAVEEAVAGLPARPTVAQFGPAVGVCTLIFDRLAADRTLSATNRAQWTARTADAGLKLVRKAKASLPAGEWQQVRTGVVEAAGLAPLRDLPECRRLLAD